MKVGIIVFPGTNREQDMAHALNVAGQTHADVSSSFIWHKETTLPVVDAVILPGGFSYGDYLRTGAIAARSPIMQDVIKRANEGLPVLGVCNGFQILCESGLLEGVLTRNNSRQFICKRTALKVENTDTVFTRSYQKGQIIDIPVAHGEGNFVCEKDVLKQIEDENRVLFRYCSSEGKVSQTTNLNGSLNNIAGICNKKRNVVGMMPHPENHVDSLQANTDGLALFMGLLAA